MTPERREYALKRVERLTNKLAQINAKIAHFNAKPRSFKIDHQLQILAKEKNSTHNSIRRWQKELGQ